MMTMIPQLKWKMHKSQVKHAIPSEFANCNGSHSNADQPQGIRGRYAAPQQQNVTAFAFAFNGGRQTLPENIEIQIAGRAERRRGEYNISLLPPQRRSTAPRRPISIFISTACYRCRRSRSRTNPDIASSRIREIHAQIAKHTHTRGALSDRERDNFQNQSWARMKRGYVQQVRVMPPKSMNVSVRDNPHPVN